MLPFVQEYDFFISLLGLKDMFFFSGLTGKQMEDWFSGSFHATKSCSLLAGPVLKLAGDSYWSVAIISIVFEVFNPEIGGEVFLQLITSGLTLMVK